MEYEFCYQLPSKNPDNTNTTSRDWAKYDPKSRYPYKIIRNGFLVDRDIESEVISTGPTDPPGL